MARQPAGLGSRDVVLVAEQPRGGEVLGEVLEGEGDHQRSRVPTVQGEAVGVEVLEQGAERAGELAGVGDGVGLAVLTVGVAGAGVGVEVGLEAFGLAGGQESGEPGGAVAGVLEEQPHPLARGLFFLEQLLGLGVLEDLRGHDLQDPSPESPDLVGGELRRSVDELGLGLVADLEGDHRRQRIQDRDDHAGMLDR